MAINFTPDDVASGYNLSKINSNFDKVDVALQDALSRSGNGPNQMEADIDLNSNDLLNVGLVDATILKVDGVSVQPVDLATALKIDNNLSELTSTAATARSNISAAESGVNSDITSLSGITTINGFAPVTAAHVPNPSASVQGTGTPGIDNGNWFIWNSPGSFDGSPTLRVDRHVSDGTGGIDGFTYQALWVLASSSINGIGYEWPFTVEFHNKTAISLSAAQNVGLNSTTFLDDEVLEVGKTWAANLNIDDRQGVQNPIGGRVSVEIDNYCTPDGGTDNNRARVGIQLAIGTGNGIAPDVGTPLHIGRGFLVGSNQANVILDRLMEVSGAGSYDIGFDTTGATFAKPVYFMKETQAIAFDGNTSGDFTRSLFYDSGSLAYKVGSNVVLTVSDAGSVSAAGNVDVAGEYRVDGVKVLSNRSTGWTAATGTATRTTFDTATVTTAQLAERVKALIDNLITHGVIGA